MEIDIRTLTEEQKNDISKWYEFIINANNKIERIDTKESINYEFEEALKIIKNWYSQSEIDSWDLQLSEAQKVIDGWTSEFIIWMLKEWESEMELATKIINNSVIYKTEFAKALQIKRNKLNSL